MKLDEFAFVNQQLAAMLRDGIPLEGALRQLCQTMARGQLRGELSALEADLAKGTPLRDALAARKLPAFYTQMLLVGATSNNLAKVLTLVADYYQHAALISTRLRGLMVYPAIVLFGCLLLSLTLAILFGSFFGVFPGIIDDLMEGMQLPNLTYFSRQAAPIGLWLPVVLLGVLTVAFGVTVSSARLRSWLRWRVTPFREVTIWQVSSALAMMLEGGCTLNDALDMILKFEQDHTLTRDFSEWRARLAAGYGDASSMIAPSKQFPQLFVWLLSSAGSDLTSGLKRAAVLYRARAEYRTEMLLQAALPVSVLVLGALIFTQVYTIAHAVLGNLLPLISISS